MLTQIQRIIFSSGKNCSNTRLYSVMVSTSDSDSGNPSSIPGTTFSFCSSMTCSAEGPIHEAWSGVFAKFLIVGGKARPPEATISLIERHQTPTPLSGTAWLLATQNFPTVKRSKYCSAAIVREGKDFDPIQVVHAEILPDAQYSSDT